ncbi:hypothetical protein HIU99_05530 [Marinobacter sp. W62]|uniref:Uncharacterized protein n=1 Tax=Marinobacter orientalis TaxID=1928859 RepID=A0A7Y0NLC9_9GAMM|nr:hypothetical protein [Marinobacter orientalis]
MILYLSHAIVADRPFKAAIRHTSVVLPQPRRARQRDELAGENIRIQRVQYTFTIKNRGKVLQ